MGQVVVVTGAAGGIGSAVAQRMRRDGWLVAGVDQSSVPDVDLSCELDVTDSGDFEKAKNRIETNFGRIDALVNAAGHYESIPFTNVSDQELNRMLQVHLGGFFTAVRTVLPSMLDRRAGSIIAITSELAVGGGDRDSHYAAAKGAVAGAVRSLAIEVAGQGIRVNAVAPGPTDTSMLAADSPWRQESYLASLPTRALAPADDVARCVQFLVESGNFITGETLHPNSGAVI